MCSEMKMRKCPQQTQLKTFHPDEILCKIMHELEEGTTGTVNKRE
jgi:hypothetical protein